MALCVRASMRPRRGSLGYQPHQFRHGGRRPSFNEAEAWKPRIHRQQKLRIPRLRPASMRPRRGSLGYALSYIRLISRAIALFFREVLFHSDFLPFWFVCRSIHYVKNHIYFKTLYGFRAGLESRALSEVSKRLGSERSIISRWPDDLSLKSFCRCSPLPE